MRLRELYQSKQIDLSIELFPPKTEEGVKELFIEVEHLRKFNPAFFSMTYGAAGSTRHLTLDLADQLKNRLGVETMCHLTVVGQSKEETCAALQFLKQKGIYNLIALRGDPPRGEKNFKPHPDGFQHAVDLVREARKMNYFSIAVAGFPEMHPDSPNLASDLRYLKEKVDAGADAVITQLFFDNRFYYDFVESARKIGIQVPIVPGILPILSVQQIRRFTNLCKSKIPPALDAQLVKYENDPEGAVQFGIEVATKQSEDLIKHSVPGLHFYALNRSHSVAAVLKNLRLPNREVAKSDERLQ